MIAESIENFDVGEFVSPYVEAILIALGANCPIDWNVTNQITVMHQKRGPNKCKALFLKLSRQRELESAENVKLKSNNKICKWSLSLIKD